MDLYSIGHSNRTWPDFVALLRHHDIRLLADIRSLPASRHVPHFGREAMISGLADAGIGYEWFKALGGRRPQRLQHSPNKGLRNSSFRNYADYMLTPEFKAAIDDLLGGARQTRLAYMCSEAVYFRCHRMLVSDFLVCRGCDVWHITGPGKPAKHRLTKEATCTEVGVLYPPLQPSLPDG